MNSPPQLDLHPDADSLNAFVEQLLTEPERAQILTHLAGCSRCRQVIFVAQQAVYAMEPELLVAAAAAPSPMTAARPERDRTRPVPSVWRVALIPAASLAAALAISIFAYVAHTRQTSELARNASQAAQQSSPIPSQPGAKEKPVPPKSTVDSIDGRQDVNKSRSSDRAATGPFVHGAIYPNAPMPLRSPIPPLTSDKNASLSAPQPVVQGFAADQFKPAPQVAGQQHVAGPMASVAGAPRIAQAQTVGAAPTSTPNPTDLDTVSVSQLQVESATQSNFSLASRQAMGKMAAARKEPLPLLPSGLRAASTATAQHRALAIDSLGAVFLSTDDGLHWTSVPQQWDGRALVVRTLSNPRLTTSGVAAFASAQASKSNEPKPEVSTSTSQTSPLFEIVTERNHVWTSSDGKIWTQRTF